MAITTSNTVISTAKDASPQTGWPVDPAPVTRVDGGLTDGGLGAAAAALGYSHIPLGTAAFQLPTQSTITFDFDVISTGADATPLEDA